MRRWLWICLLISLLCGWVDAARAQSMRNWSEDYAPNEVLVRWVEKPASPDVAAEVQRLGLSDARLKNVQSAVIQDAGVKTAEPLSARGVERLSLPAGRSVPQVLAQLKNSPLVKYCEPNYRRYAFSPLSNGPNDTYYQSGDLWWLEAVQADKAWAGQLVPQGAPVIIAIIDTGIMLAHADLSARLVAGKDYVRVNGNANDDHGHGTHAAGIAAASINNGLGIAGVAGASNVKLMPIKVLNSSGRGYDSDIIQGVYWAVDHGAKVINLSLGSPNTGDTFKDAVQYAHDKGCVVVAAAGNEAVDKAGNPDNPVMYPAAYNTVIAVAACDSVGVRAYYSEYGDYVDVAAPGGVPSASNSTSMLSTYPNGGAGAYAYLAGTSMAAPVVSGVAAMLLAQNPNRTPEEVENLMITTAEKTGRDVYGSGWNKYLGWGRVNCYKALTQASTFAPKTNGHASYNYPNPFQSEKEKTFIVVPMQAGQTSVGATLKIYDIIGHLVHSQEVAPAQVYPGSLLTWDGRNDRGEAVANGVYPYRLEINGTVYTNKIAVKN